MSSTVRPPQDQPTITIEAAAGGFFGAAAEAEAGSEVWGDEDFERVGCRWSGSGPGEAPGSNNGRGPKPHSRSPQSKDSAFAVEAQRR